MFIKNNYKKKLPCLINIIFIKMTLTYLCWYQIVVVVVVQSAYRWPDAYGPHQHSDHGPMDV